MEPIKDTYPDLFWAYLVTWALIVAYVFYLGMRLRRLEKRTQKSPAEL